MFNFASKFQCGQISKEKTVTAAGLYICGDHTLWPAEVRHNISTKPNTDHARRQSHFKAKEQLRDRRRDNVICSYSIYGIHKRPLLCFFSGAKWAKRAANRSKEK